MHKLKEIIAEKEKQLSNTKIPNLFEREFFEEFLKNYNAHNFDTYENVSNAAYFMAVLAANNINMSFEELNECMEIIEDFVNDVDFDLSDYYSYIEQLEILNNLGLLKKIVDKDELDKENKKEYKKYQKISKKLFNSKNENNNQNVFEKLFLLLPQPEKFKSFIGLYAIVDGVKNVIENVIDEGFQESINDDAFTDYERNIFKGKRFNKFVEKEKNRMMKEHIKEFMEMTGIDLIGDYDLICKHYQQILKEDKEVVKTINKKIKALEELNYKLKYIKPERLLKIDSNINEFLFDSDIKYNYLLFAISHNYNIYQNEEQKNIDFNNNSFTKVEILFSKYGFNFNDFNDEERNKIINEIEFSKVENILNLVKYSELSFISDYSGEFAKIIIFSKPEIIKFIDLLLKNKIIDKKFIFKNINILYDTSEYKTLYNNVNYLNSIGVKLINLVKNDSDILLLNSDELITKTNILSEYNFRLDMDDLYNFDCLKDDKILDLIDNFIELGLKDIILQNPKYITIDGFDIIKRIMICNLIGFNPINKSNKIIGSVCTGNNFYADPKFYDNYIINYQQDYQNPICIDILEKNSRNTISSSTKGRVFIKRLDELYMKDELTYVINGVVISRNRVIRNMETLLKSLSNNKINVADLVYQSILYKMINNVEPTILEQIYNSIYSIELELKNNKIYTLK